MDDVSEVKWRAGELVIPTVRQRVGPLGRLQTIARVDKEKLSKVEGLISYYEIKEATTLFELALWKARIDQAVDEVDYRDAHRIEVPGPVKDTILQYLN